MISLETERKDSPNSYYIARVASERTLVDATVQYMLG